MERDTPYRALKTENHMLYLAMVFFVSGVFAAVLGFGDVAAGAAGIAKIVSVVFLVLLVLSLFFSRWRRGGPFI